MKKEEVRREEEGGDKRKETGIRRVGKRSKV